MVEEFIRHFGLRLQQRLAEEVLDDGYCGYFARVAMLVGPGCRVACQVNITVTKMLTMGS